MKRTSLIALTTATLLTSMGASALADLTFYTNRTAWEAAAGGPLLTEDFNSIPGVYYYIDDYGFYHHYYLPLEEGHNLVGDHPLDIERRESRLPPGPDNSIWPGTSSLTVDGTNFLRAATVDAYGGLIRIHLPEPVTAYAGEFAETHSGSGVVVQVDGDYYQFEDLLPAYPGNGFVGFVSSEPISKLTFICNDPWYGGSFGHDNLAWLPAPAGGACCLPDGSCAWGTEGDCTALGGVFQGLGTACDMNPCATDTSIDFYRFEGDGDDSQGDSNGVVGANVSFGPGVNGQAAVFGTEFYFGDTSHRIDVPQTLAFTPGEDDFSFACWIKRDQDPTDQDDIDGIFDALDGANDGFQTYLAPDNTLVTRLDDRSGAWLDVRSTGTITDTTEWHHVALTVDRLANEATWYIDGVPEAPVDISVLIAPIELDHELRIGGQNGGPGYRGLDGSLDELGFFPYKLSADDIADLMQGPSAPGDVDGDGDVDQADLGYLLSAYNACDGDPNYNPDADFDNNGCVDQSDLGVLLGNYGG